MELTPFSAFNNDIFIRLVTAATLGTLFGLERGFARKDPSLRTFMIISLGSCAFTIVSISGAEGIPGTDPTRIAAQILTGIGFLGAGTIFKSKDRIQGLTTAALMWMVAAVGMAVGFGRLDIASGTSLVALTFMVILNFVHRILQKISPRPALDQSTHKSTGTHSEHNE